MRSTEAKQRKWLEDFEQSVEESKKTLQSIKRDQLEKEDFHSRTLEKVKVKC